MMGKISSFPSRSSDDFASGGIPVLLNVYDLTQLNSYVRWCGVGIYHSGIEVHGLEYGFGAHEYPSSGVFQVEPKCCPGFIYRCSILLGYIDMAATEFHSLIQRMAVDYHGDTYHLISKNCNHFTEDVCSRLTGKPIPGWINRLARLGAYCNCLLPESLGPPSSKHAPDSHGGVSEDGSCHSAESEDGCDQERRLISSAVVGVVIIKEAYR